VHNHSEQAMRLMVSKAGNQQNCGADSRRPDS
jgi:hypothetical protein